MRYLRTLNYLERKALFDPTYMMSLVDLVTIIVDTPRIDSGCSLVIELTKLICMNFLMVLYLFVNHLDSCHGYVHGHLTSNVKNILLIHVMFVNMVLDNMQI